MADTESGLPDGAQGGTRATVEILVRRLGPDVPLPTYARPGDAGADLVTTVPVSLAPGQRALVPTGLAIAVPDGYAAFVHPRSGLAARVGLSLVNTPGTVDAGYRGEIKLVLINQDPVHPLHLAAGDRVAQLVVQRVEWARFVETDVLPDSARGTGGHGSTGGSVALDAAVDQSGAGRTSRSGQGWRSEDGVPAP